MKHLFRSEYSSISTKITMSRFLVHICLMVNIAASCAGSVDWSEIYSRYTRIKDEVLKVIISSKSVAWIDDCEIAVENFEKLDYQYPNVLRISQEAESLISSKTLTSEKAEALFRKFQTAAHQYFQSTGWTDSVQLSIRVVVIKIVSHVLRNFNEIKQILDGIYKAEVDWNEIEGKILTIEGKLQHVLNYINAVAWLENETLSRYWNVDIIGGCTSLLNEAYALSGNKSLTVEKVMQAENHISNGFLDAKTKLDYETLSPSTKNEILEVMSGATSQIHLRFREIIELLSGNVTPTTDWEKVLRFFTKIQAEVFYLVPKVGLAFLEENDKQNVIHERISQYLQLELLKLVEFVKLVKSNSKSLTADDAYEIIQQILSELLNIDREVRDLMGIKVDSRVKSKVKGVMAETYALISEIQLNIYELLKEDDNIELSYQDELYDFLNNSHIFKRKVLSIVQNYSHD